MSLFRRSKRVFFPTAQQVVKAGTKQALDAPRARAWTVETGFANVPGPFSRIRSQLGRPRK